MQFEPQYLVVTKPGPDGAPFNLPFILDCEHLLEQLPDIISESNDSGKEFEITIVKGKVSEYFKKSSEASRKHNPAQKPEREKEG